MTTALDGRGKARNPLDADEVGLFVAGLCFVRISLILLVVQLRRLVVLDYGHI